MNISLQGRVALVTGGMGDIGTALCRQLADSGAKVATNYRNEEKAQKWLAEQKAAGYDFKTYKADLGNFEQCKAMVEQITAELGGVDILVNNAGITRDVTLRKMTPEQWREVINSNLDSVYNVTRQVVEGMMAKGWGRIINMSSINGQKGQMGQSNYCATKAGMHGFTMALAQEVARKGVTVNTVSPGYIESDMINAVPEEIRKQIVAQIPVGRFGTCADVAYLVDFLCAEQAGFITGADFASNGGQHMM
jgi:acetoacetyl-CoA reductase